MSFKVWYQLLFFKKLIFFAQGIVVEIPDCEALAEQTELQRIARPDRVALKEN